MGENQQVTFKLYKRETTDFYTVMICVVFQINC